MKYPEQTTPQRLRMVKWLLGTKGVKGKWGVTAIKYRLSFRGNENVLKFIMSMVAHL